MTEFTEILKLLTAIVGLLAALAKAVPEAHERSPKHKKKGHRR